MRSPLIPPILAALLALAAAMASPALAGSKPKTNDDQEAARVALQRGEILPLARILEIAAKRAPGDVVKVKIEREDGRFIYELKVLAKSGRVLELEIDARSGAVLKIEDD